MRVIVLGFVAVLLLSACGGGSDVPGVTAAGSPPTETEPTETAPVFTVAAIPETPITAELEEAYRVEEGSISDPDESELPVPPGAVEAWWYKSGGRWVVVYTGVPEDAGPMCPGNSILVETSYESVSNSPTEGASCGSATLAEDPAGVRECTGNLVYVTEIDTAKEGALTASIERYEGSVIFGVTGVVSSDVGTAPEVELSELGC